MCGIYGTLSSRSQDLEAVDLDLMGATMRHRGPDDRGTYVDRMFKMGMERLSIIDVEGGRQPILNEDGKIAAVCNGEIYNFRSLRNQLRSKGHEFRSGSDAEVIVHLYEEYGTSFPKHLSGMFAIALWDSEKERLVLVRDRLGIKPLYVYASPDTLIFASELKSILAIPTVPRQVNALAIREFLSLGYVPAPLTMIDNVQKLHPGTVLIADSEGQRTERYWSYKQNTNATLSEQEWVQSISSTIERAVVSQMVSDVPLGAFLSGGIDSSAVVAYMAQNSAEPIKTYSIGFDTDSGGSYYNELPYARQVAERFGTDHSEIVVKPDVAELIPELLWHMDEPMADAALLTTYLVSKFASQDVKVILSGVGGDELFGGYRRYWSENLAQNYGRIPEPIRRHVIQPLARTLPSDRHSAVLDYLRLVKGFLAAAELPSDERYERYIRVFSPEALSALIEQQADPRSGTLVSAFAESSQLDGVGRLIEVDLRTQLPDDLLMLTDRMSMATSLECRVPLLDDDLVELSSSMPSELKIRGRELKYGLKKALRGVLPDEIIDRKKRGFGAPIGSWIKRELAPFFGQVINEQSVRDRGLLDWNGLEVILESHRSNREDYTDHLLAVLNLELWCRLYIDGERPDSLADSLGEVNVA